MNSLGKYSVKSTPTPRNQLRLQESAHIHAAATAVILLLPTRMTSRRHEDDDDPHEVHEDDESEGYQAHPVPRRVNKRPPPPN